MRKRVVALLMVLGAGLAVLASAQAPGQGEAAPEYSFEQVASGFTQPVQVVSAPGDLARRLFVVERAGRVQLVIPGDKPVTWLDLGTRVLISPDNYEEGLLSVALAPDFNASQVMYALYTGSTVVGPAPASIYVSRFRPAPLNPVPALRVGPPAGWVEEVLFVIPKTEPHHNGGHLAFGNDGLLYVSTGDGVWSGMPNSQDPRSPLGKILAVDVTAATPAPVVVASGLRNPFRFSFDGPTGDLWIGDVGNNLQEEVNYVKGGTLSGQNFGWPYREGPNCFPPGGPCVDGSYTDPVYAYPHVDGDCAITGGYVYRGARIPSLRGAYVFADFCSGRVRALRQVDGAWTATVLFKAPNHVVSFGMDSRNELLAADFYAGKILRLKSTELATPKQSLELKERTPDDRASSTPSPAGSTPPRLDPDQPTQAPALTPTATPTPSKTVELAPLPPAPHPKSTPTVSPFQSSPTPGPWVTKTAAPPSPTPPGVTNP